ncbi:MAG: patatin-like phospholipase family protein [Mariprofundus sp.]|nr:patatin-like phospholipase family protein [Mariprofundus sp.]
MSAPEEQPNQTRSDYITGAEFDGKLLETELDHIFGEDPDNRSKDREKHLFGLAFSGGGIRSATFSLGVMQALAEKGWLNKIHYLSTVSGGSYIGSSLTWLLHKAWKTGDGEKLCFDVGNSFPYKRFDDTPKADSKSAKDKEKLDQSKMLLRYLRQHGNYLTPGGGITGLSLLAVILRGALLSLLVYIVPLIAAIIVLNAAGLFGDTAVLVAGTMKASALAMNPCLWLALIPLGVFAFVSVIYGLSTSQKRSSKKAYGFRRNYEIKSRWLLIITGIFLILGSLPMAYAGLGELLGSVAISFGGLLATVFSILGSQKKGGGKIPLALLAPLALILMVYGVLLLAFSGAIHFSSIHYGLKWAGLIIVLLSFWLSRCVNINHISIHRYYRDRLMELFMPNAEKLFSKQHMDQDNLANEAKLSDMCQFRNAATKENKIVGPYHIINANMVTINSSYMKLRARGGDNFILSPLYCGNAVTGWMDTKKYMDGDMSLATAMAISGAAADPHGAPGGVGLTRNWSLSLLMALLNVRLGYWAPNPNPKKNMSNARFPTWFRQGWHELTGSGMTEKDAMVHLADGGHFENLALYELVRRRVKTIVVCDGAADAGYTFSDFSNFVEKVRVDFGATVNMPSLLRMCPTPAYDSHGNKKNQFAVDTAEKGYLVGEIIYDDGSTGTLAYIKTTMIEKLPKDIYGYQSAHADFPDETTADQFFDEKQFEAYRELGYRIGLTLTQDESLNVPF